MAARAAPEMEFEMTNEAPRRHVSAPGIEVGDLLRRYPKLDQRERERLLEGYKALTMFDRAMMTSDEGLRAPLDAFRRDHRRRLRPPLWQPILLLGMPVSMLIAVAWGLWQTAVGG
jgi:hypothetical protein